MVFMRVILLTTLGAHKAHKIRRRITRYLNLWEIRKHANFSLDTVTESQSWPARAAKYNNETAFRAFNSRVFNGKITAMVRGIQG